MHGYFEIEEINCKEVTQSFALNMLQILMFKIKKLNLNVQNDGENLFLQFFACHPSKIRN